ncbi:MAG: HXXEE domain-containing protein [Chloroflexi bacterium]|nr:HXXEE domain-containing protein [Chloroflexota bacterium]
MKKQQVYAVTTGLVVLVFSVVLWNSFGRTTMPIIIPTIISYFVWLKTTYKQPANYRDILIIYLLAVATQIAHLLEEFLTEAYVELPILFNADSAISKDSFVIIFILGASFLYVLGAIGLIKRNPFANYFVWFVALGPMLANSIAHTYATVVTREYFPGLITTLIQVLVAVIFIRALMGKRLPVVLKMT